MIMFIYIRAMNIITEEPESVSWTPSCYFLRNSPLCVKELEIRDEHLGKD